MTIQATALAVYGRENQIRKTLEELAELSLELHRALDGRGDPEHILEEMADVEIMLGQMKLLYGSTDGWKEKKLARLEERIHGQKMRRLYNWGKAPKWAQWAARDEDGTFCWYKKKPNASKYYKAWACDFENSFEDGDESHILDASGDWRDSLERRPASKP